MALGRSRRGERTIDYWPGFVDALSTMLLVITVFGVGTSELGARPIEHCINAPMQTCMPIRAS